MGKYYWAVWLVLITFSTTGCERKPVSASPSSKTGASNMGAITVESSAFAPNQPIPRKHTAEGELVGTYER